VAPGRASCKYCWNQAVEPSGTKAGTKPEYCKLYVICVTAGVRTKWNQVEPRLEPRSRAIKTNTKPWFWTSAPSSNIILIKRGDDPQSSFGVPLQKAALGPTPPPRNLFRILGRGALKSRRFTPLLMILLHLALTCVCRRHPTAT
jgi:hypothetical protein